MQQGRNFNVLPHQVSQCRRQEFMFMGSELVFALRSTGSTPILLNGSYLDLPTPKLMNFKPMQCRHKVFKTSGAIA